MSDKLLLIGNPDPIHIGVHLFHAAKSLGLDTQICDVRQSQNGSILWNKLNWWFRHRKPYRLKEFSSEVIRVCREFKPKWMLAVGLAPIEAGALHEIGKLGVLRLNYLTDDPWNPAHKASWFMKALPFYDQIFSVRHSHLDDLRQIGCRVVSYLPFGYAPELHYPDPPKTSQEQDQFDYDVVFAGGADRDRIPYITSLIKNGFRVGLYGGYWDRFPETKPCARGHADPQTLRKAIGGSKVALCLVRRANRDGNSMRTFEIPAMKGCMLVEDTEDHREIFGEEGKTVLYFQSIPGLVEKTQWLLSHEEERRRLADAVHMLIVEGKHTYLDRLESMLKFTPSRFSGVDPFVQEKIAATHGQMYKTLINRLNRYPIPELRIPPGTDEYFLDLGCNWGRWCIAAVRRGYTVVGIDPSYEAIQAARRVAQSLSIPAQYVVADARHLPFIPECFDAIHSYSVLQHFEKQDTETVLQEIRYALKPSGMSRIQMANAFGIRSFFHQLIRGFRKAQAFEVRYWKPGELRLVFEKEIGPTSLSSDGYLSLNPQLSDQDLLPRRYQWVVKCSEILRVMSCWCPWLINIADSLLVESRKKVSGGISLKIALVVHGRFHAFDFAHALLERGHQVTLFTNYPGWAVKSFGVSAVHVRGFWWHGILSRLFLRLRDDCKFPYPEAYLHQMFGRWAAGLLERESWDVIHSWSGISEEILIGSKESKALKLLMRGSSHIRTQARILEEEEKRTGISLDKPSPWMIEREEREYELADGIVVLSTFAYQSFVSEGVAQEKLHLIPLGLPFESFRPSPEVIETRYQRIRSGNPLQVLWVGALSFQKGLWDMSEIIHHMDPARFRFRLIGSRTPEVKKLLTGLSRPAEFIPKQRQNKLSQWYKQADLFLSPTLQDGYSIVLSQAYANGLPILTTDHCSGPDLIREGETGWVLPIRNPGAFIDRLRWCDEHREELANMVRRIYGEPQPRSWADVALDFEGLFKGKKRNFVES